MARKSLLLSLAARRLGGEARAAKTRKARQLALRANHIDNSEPLALLAFYESFNQSGERPPENALEGLFQVVSMLPRDYRVRQLLVDQLARDKRYDEAMAWLLPIANSPHESPRREAARSQMEQLRAAKAASTGSSPAKD